MVPCLYDIHARVSFYDTLEYMALIEKRLLSFALSWSETCSLFLFLSLGNPKEPVSIHGQSCWSLVGLMLQILSDVAFFLPLKRRIVNIPVETYLFCMLYVLRFLSSLVLSSPHLSSDFLINAGSAKTRDKGRRTSLGRNRQRLSD